MKLSVYHYVGLSTVLWLLVAGAVALNTPLKWVFLLTVIGQFSVLIMVYKVITDNYTTRKTFDDFYEDCPMDQDEA